MHSVPLMEVRGRHGDRNDFLSQTYTFEKEWNDVLHFGLYIYSKWNTSGKLIVLCTLYFRR
jgi:hypothetical protein